MHCEWGNEAKGEMEVKDTKEQLRVIKTSPMTVMEIPIIM